MINGIVSQPDSRPPRQGGGAPPQQQQQYGYAPPQQYQAYGQPPPGGYYAPPQQYGQQPVQYAPQPVQYYDPNAQYQQQRAGMAKVPSSWRRSAPLPRPAGADSPGAWLLWLLYTLEPSHSGPNGRLRCGREPRP